MTQTLAKVAVLRVYRAFAGVKFPFDKVYFFNKEQEHLLPKIYPFALVLSATRRFLELVDDVVKTQKPVLQAFAFRRRDEEKLAKYTACHNPLNPIFEHPDKYVALVPMLFVTGSSSKKGDADVSSNPKYITAHPCVHIRKRRGRNATTERMTARQSVLRSWWKKAMTSRSYLLLEGNKVQPVCVVCPNAIDNINGKCVLGESKCYESLSMARAGDFACGLRAYEAFRNNIDEPELAESKDEQLHAE